MLQELITTLIPVIVAALTQPLFEGLQRVFGFIAGIPATLKPIVYALLTFGGTKLTVALGVTVSVVDPTQWTAGDIGAIAAAGIGTLFHLLYKQKAVAKATGA